MPELPEVETVRRFLASRLPGERIGSIEALLPRVIRGCAPEAFRAALEGRSFAAAERKGKYLVLRTDGPQSLLVHLRMTGRLTWQGDKGAPLPPYARVVFRLSGGTLVYGDVRTLGELRLIPSAGKTGVPGFDALGPDAIGPEFTVEGLARALRGSRRAVKAFLLDQANVAGIGNIYADEALFRAGILPSRPACGVTPEEASRLRDAVRGVMEESLSRGGTTFRDFRDAEGKKGGNAPALQVYGRGGLPCPKCGTRLEFSKIAGRGTRFCPRCQN